MEAGRDMRSEKRKLCIAEVEFSLKDVDCSVKDCGPWVNYTCDISSKGIGFYSTVPLEKGSLIEILLRPFETKTIHAEVRWCLPYSDNLFRVGAMFPPKQSAGMPDGAADSEPGMGQDFKR